MKLVIYLANKKKTKKTVSQLIEDNQKYRKTVQNWEPTALRSFDHFEIQPAKTYL